MRRIANRLAKQVVTTAYISGRARGEGRLPSQNYVVLMHQANEVDIHIVFASTRESSVQREADNLRRLLVDFAIECEQRACDAADSQFRRKPTERKWAGRRKK